MRKKMLLLALSLTSLAGAFSTLAEARVLPVRVPAERPTLCCFCEQFRDHVECECGPCAEPGV